MTVFTLPMRKDAMEYIEYRENTFPLNIWYDYYSAFTFNRLPLHWHEAFEIIILLSGKIDYYINGVCYSLNPHDCLFINSNKMHCTKADQNEEDSIVFGIVFLPGVLGCSPNDICYRKFFQPVLQSDKDTLKIDAATDRGKKISDIMLEIEKLDPESYFYEMEILSFLVPLWTEILHYFLSTNLNHKLSKPHKHEREIKEIISFIHTHYSEQIAVKDLLQLTCISRSECFRTFRDITNMTPVEYINRYRMAKATDMLCNSDKNITEIYTSCGFCSSSYFGKLFKKKYGMSPLQYRKFNKEKYFSEKTGLKENTEAFG